MISSRPFITAVSARIGEILKEALVNGQIFSTVLYNVKSRSEQIPVVLIPQSRALVWHAKLKKSPRRVCGRGEQTCWSESDGPEQT